MKYKATRIVVLVAMFAVVLIVYAATLYKMQIYAPSRAAATAEERPLVETRRVETIRAGRGDILDRYGNKLVSSRPSYDVVLTRRPILDAENTNEIISELVHMVIDSGVAYNDAFPVNTGAPFEYRYDMTSQQRSRLNTYFEYFRLDPDISADDLIVWLKSHYGIPFTTGIAEARLIIGVRYELEIRAIVTNMSPYVFAEDVTAETVAQIAERNYPGVSIQIGSVREYYTTSAAHLLGYLSRMNDAEIAQYVEPLGYPLDALIGKSGVEAAYEQYLHGKDGRKVVSLSADGAVIDETITEEAVPGANVYLSIDIDLQEKSEAAMTEKIRTINLTREEGQLIPAASVVAVLIETAEPLVIASYPTFDPATMQRNYTELSADPGNPLFNRALQGLYSPGSTFKPVTALAALRTGTISRYTPIEDHGQFTKYESYQPRCWIYGQAGVTHGTLDVVGALRDSCNYFFYKIGDDMGPSHIAQAAYDFGFGAKTLSDININEKDGIVATAEYKREALDTAWYAADTLLVSIGQGLNQFTPIQLANYTATIANGGILRELSLLHSVKSADYSGTIYSHEPTTRSVIPETEYIEILREGMRAVAKSGTARNMFGSYPIAVAAKTGTVQTGEDYNDGVFICYAPAENPEIAVAVVVEKGGSGAEIMEIAKIVLDEYFAGSPYSGVIVEGELAR